MLHGALVTPPAGVDVLPFPEEGSILDKITWAIKQAELVMGPGNGAQKKAKILDLVVQLYNESGVDIPWVPNFLEPRIVRIVAGLLIDLVVQQLNKSGLMPKAV